MERKNENAKLHRKHTEESPKHYKFKRSRKSKKKKGEGTLPMAIWHSEENLDSVEEGFKKKVPAIKQDQS